MTGVARETMTTGVAAARIGVSGETIRQMIDEKILEGFRPMGHKRQAQWRVFADSVERYCRENGLTVEAAE